MNKKKNGANSFVDVVDGGASRGAVDDRPHVGVGASVVGEVCGVNVDDAVGEDAYEFRSQDVAEEGGYADFGA